MMPLSKKLSIKALVLKSLNESNEPFFHLAPDVVGSINNAYPDKSKKYFIVDFTTIDNKNPKLIVPFKTFTNFSSSQEDKSNIVKNFLSAFLQDVKKIEGSNEMLGEIVDEFGQLSDDDDDDKPANVKGASGYYNTKSTASALPQYTSRMTTVASPLGYGGVVY